MNNSGTHEELTPFASNFEPTASLMPYADIEDLHLGAMLHAWTLLEYRELPPQISKPGERVLNPETEETDFELSPSDFLSNA